MADEVLKRFLIVGDGAVQEVGARPRIYELANKNGVKVFPRNVQKNRIEVVVKGDDESIKRYWNCIKEADLRPLSSGVDGSYEVRNLKPCEEEPDFAYFAGSSTMEQVSKGTYYLRSIDKKLDRLDELRKLDKLGKLDKLDKLDRLDELRKLDKLGKLDKLDTLPEDIAKELAKVLHKK